MCPDKSRYDGIRREICKALDGPGPFIDVEVLAAAQQALVVGVFGAATASARRVPRH
jgi:hypothetical protein